MKFKFILMICVFFFLMINVLIFLPFFFIEPSFESSYCEDCFYTPWGVEEYELLGLKKDELSKNFNGKLFFSKDFKRATFSEEGTGLGYQGAVFNLSFSNGKVSSVQGIFEGCTYKYKRPRFKSKRVALNYSIDHLSSYNGADEQRSLKQAKQALAELKKVLKDKEK